MRSRWALGFAGVFRAALAVSAVAVATTWTPALMAQSAADKATARTLAIDGIALFKKDKYADALDKLQRAQQLYDAPIHLVYIGRCYAKLGQYVESAEAYRKLLRANLDKDSPQAFKDAVADGKKELPEVEPKIASLRIDVTPAKVGGLELKIDDVDVSSAVVGIDRQTNPGKRHITASAPGYKPSEQFIELKPGEKKTIALALESDGSGAALPPDEGKGDKGDKDKGDKGDKGGKEPEEPVPEGGIGFLVGLKLGAGLPAGQLTKDEAMKDYFGAGGGSELRAGVRFAQRYTALLVGGLYSYQSGNKLEKVDGVKSSAKTVPTGTEAGVGFMVATPPGKLGFFGELDVLFIHRFEASRDLDINPGGRPTPPDPLPEKCTQKLKAFGSAARLTGGLQIPMTPWLQLSPYAGVGFGQVTDFSVTDGCSKVDKASGISNKGSGLADTPWGKGGEVGNAAQTTHLVVTLGIGGDLLFGNDKPSK